MNEKKLIKVLFFKPKTKTITKRQRKLFEAFFNVGRTYFSDELVAVCYKDGERIPVYLLEELKKLGHVSMEWTYYSRVKSMF